MLLRVWYILREDLSIYHFGVISLLKIYFEIHFDGRLVSRSINLASFHFKIYFEIHFDGKPSISIYHFGLIWKRFDTGVDFSSVSCLSFTIVSACVDENQWWSITLILMMLRMKNTSRLLPLPSNFLPSLFDFFHLQYFFPNKSNPIQSHYIKMKIQLSWCNIHLSWYWNDYDDDETNDRWWCHLHWSHLLTRNCILLTATIACTTTLEYFMINILILLQIGHYWSIKIFSISPEPNVWPLRRWYISH